MTIGTTRNLPKASSRMRFCGLCQKNCEAGAITVIDNIARIDYDKCTHCGVCVEKCPKKIIVAHADL